MKEIRFSVPGRVEPTQTGMVVRNKKTGRAFPIRRNTEYSGRVKLFSKAAASRAMWQIERGPVEVFLVEHRVRPKSLKNDPVPWPITRPDVDNLAKGVLDAMSGVFFVDDSQIVMLHIGKTFTATEPYLEVTIRRLLYVD